MRLTTYLSFDGNTREALEFYARVFNGKVIDMMTFGESAARDHVPASVHDKIMHGCVQLGADQLMATDGIPGHEYAGVVGMQVVYQADAPDEAERIFAALAEGGTIRMPIAKTFWARAYGMLTDRFGTPWMVNCT